MSPQLQTLPPLPTLPHRPLQPKLVIYALEKLIAQVRAGQRFEVEGGLMALVEMLSTDLAMQEVSVCRPVTH